MILDFFMAGTQPLHFSPRYIGRKKRDKSK
jgi:hypothetical protein